MRSAELAPPSPFFLAHAERIADAARDAPVLDLACGRGRHCIATAEAGHRVVGVDRDPAHLSELHDRARALRLPVFAVRADLENEREIPFKTNTFGAILVFRFLYRPLAPRIVAALRPGGLLLYETFTLEQQQLSGGPSRPAFLLAPGELPALFPQLDTIESWEGRTEGDPPQALARLAARKPA